MGKKEQRMVSDLTVALQVQWEYNHAEHCSWEWPHPEGTACMWPLPTVFGGDPGEYRTYQDLGSTFKAKPRSVSESLTKLREAFERVSNR